MKPGYTSNFQIAWGSTLSLTALAATMAVNTLVTGLIVFKILKVFLKVKITSIERALGSAAGRPNYHWQHIAFLIIESGMALFAVYLVRIVITTLLEVNLSPSRAIILAFNLVVAFHQKFNVTIRSIHFYFFDLLIKFTLARALHRQQFWYGLQRDCPSKTKSPSRKVSEVLIFIIPRVIRIHQYWEAVVPYRSRR